MGAEGWNAGPNYPSRVISTTLPRRVCVATLITKSSSIYYFSAADFRPNVIGSQGSDVLLAQQL